MEELFNPIDRLWELIVACFWLAGVIGFMMLVMFFIHEVRNAPVLEDDGTFRKRKTGERF